jgi:hypothetical protein
MFFMLKTTCGIGAVLAVGLALTLAGPAQATTTDAATPTTEATINVPSDFLPGLSSTKATGHYEVVDTALHIWTDGIPSTLGSNKVAEYVATDVPLADVGEPSLDYDDNSGGTATAPGFQLVVDFDGDGSYIEDGVKDGILVGEPIYGDGDQWWVTASAPAWVQEADPETLKIGGTDHVQGTLAQWRDAFPNAQVLAFGFSLGGGVLGDGTLNAINFAGTHYTFADSVVLGSKNECKSGGWATSMIPLFRNQGDCVSYFATAKQ